jgi:uncharacterized Zn finger protein
MLIDLSCAECGKNRFSLSEAESDDCLIRCEDCGHEVGTLGDLKQQVSVEVLRRSASNPQPPDLAS